MNERIIEIANEANKSVGYQFQLEDAKQLHELMHKFAELIVMECIECVDGYTKPRTGNTEYDAVEQIKQHFGVES